MHCFSAPKFTRGIPGRGIYHLLPIFLLLLISANSIQGEESTEYDPNRFEVSVLTGDLQRPMELAVAPDGQIYFIELAGRLRRVNPTTEKVETLGEIKVTTANENGLIGIALDPKFAENGWIYLQYSPPDFPGQHISRFTLKGDSLDLASEKLLFKFEEQRLQCCHHAGSMTFGPDGCLYIATGDNTHPFGASGSYAPIDERKGREPWDAQKSAANTMSGAGKVLRIRPTDDGRYEIPDGNLFPRDGSEGLPEIYVMGCRNPWRISVDAKTGILYWGDVGPDAGKDGPRGPRGYDEINQARSAGNFGWPYFIANNRPYHDVDFATGKAGEPFDAAKPVNDSPNNTGARILPPAQPAMLYYPSAGSPEFPQLNGAGGRTACAGPVYHFDAAVNTERNFPARFDGALFIYEWSRHWIKVVHLDDEGKVKQIEPFMPNRRFVRPIDMQFGPGGTMYLIEYGSTWGVNKDARLIRIDYASGNRRPTVKATATNNIGREPLEVSFSSEGTFDKDPGDQLRYQWRSIRSGEPADSAKVISQDAHAKVVFAERGIFNVELQVTDSQGAVGKSVVPVVVGNTRPEVKLTQPANGDFFDPEQPVRYQVYVRDFEDGSSDFDEAEEKDLDVIHGRANERVTVTASIIQGHPDAKLTDPPGMRLMKGSDCFNCHAVDKKRIGPPLLEISKKYRDRTGALDASVKRVLAGSSGVWGKVPMIPHTQHTEAQVRTMVSWIYSLQEEGGLQVFQGLRGTIPALTENDDKSGHLALEATYIDEGRSDIPALSSSAKIVIRNRHTEAEHADTIHGARILTAAKGAQFIGAVNHGHYIKFKQVNLSKVSAVTVRVASAGKGGQIELHGTEPNGPLLATFNVQVNGHWENWYDVKENLKAIEGVHDLYFVFINAKGGSGLMNLESIYFHP